MSLVAFVPQAHINTSLTEADKMEVMDKSGQSRLSEGGWGRSESATHHSACSINQQRWTAHSGLWRCAEEEVLSLILTNDNRCLVAEEKS